MAEFCSKCGGQLTAGRKYCSQCGAATPEFVAGSPARQPALALKKSALQSPADAGAKLRFTLLASFLLVLAGTVAYGVVSWWNSQRSQTRLPTTAAVVATTRINSSPDAGAVPPRPSSAALSAAATVVQGTARTPASAAAGKWVADRTDGSDLAYACFSTDGRASFGRRADEVAWRDSCTWTPNGTGQCIASNGPAARPFSWSLKDDALIVTQDAPLSHSRQAELLRASMRTRQLPTRLK